MSESNNNISSSVSSFLKSSVTAVCQLLPYLVSGLIVTVSNFLSKSDEEKKASNIKITTEYAKNLTTILLIGCICIGMNISSWLGVALLLFVSVKGVDWFYEIITKYIQDKVNK